MLTIIVIGLVSAIFFGVFCLIIITMIDKRDYND